MNKTLKAVAIEVSGGNVRNHHINLRGTDGLFPNDSFGGRNAGVAGKPIRLRIGTKSVHTDIDATKHIFRERSAIRRFFEEEAIVEGDLVLIERLALREYAVSKASKRGFKYYL